MRKTAQHGSSWAQNCLAAQSARPGSHAGDLAEAGLVVIGPTISFKVTTPRPTVRKKSRIPASAGSSCRSQKPEQEELRGVGNQTRLPPAVGAAIPQRHIGRCVTVARMACTVVGEDPRRPALVE
jgi:hypothetical protein